MKNILYLEKSALLCLVASNTTITIASIDNISGTHVRYLLIKCNFNAN